MSDHLNDEEALLWLEETLPEILRLIAEVTDTLTRFAGCPDELTSLQGEYLFIKLPAA